MGYFKRLLNSRLASAQAERVQLFMFVLWVLALATSGAVAGLVPACLLMMFWAVELVCRAIEQRPMTVIVRREREDEP